MGGIGNGEWIGVDLDGTLAVYDTWKGPEHVGEPIVPMVERVKSWLRLGIDVRIFTARVCEANEREPVVRAIEAWCLEHLGVKLPITNVKDYSMVALYDDRAVQVEKNAGELTMDRLRDAEERYEGACVTIAQMHAAAVGEVTGPKRGVVEDVADVRAKMLEWKKGVEDANRLTQEYDRRCEKLERENDALRAQLAAAPSAPPRAAPETKP